MKSLFLIAGLLVSGSALAQESVQVDAVASEYLANQLRVAEQAGNSPIQFVGGPQVTTYAVGNLSCYFQNQDDSASCSAASELSAEAASVVGPILREGASKGMVVFEGGPQVTTYSLGNLTCYFQGSDDSVSCSVQ
jgi:hypothetical protein